MEYFLAYSYYDRLPHQAVTVPSNYFYFVLRCIHLHYSNPFMEDFNIIWSNPRVLHIQSYRQLIAVFFFDFAKLIRKWECYIAYTWFTRTNWVGLNCARWGAPIIWLSISVIALLIDSDESIATQWWAMLVWLAPREGVPIADTAYIAGTTQGCIKTCEVCAVTVVEIANCTYIDFGAYQTSLQRAKLAQTISIVQNCTCIGIADRTCC